MWDKAKRIRMQSGRPDGRCLPCCYGMSDGARHVGSFGEARLGRYRFIYAVDSTENKCLSSFKWAEGCHRDRRRKGIGKCIAEEFRKQDVRVYVIDKIAEITTLVIFLTKLFWKALLKK